MIKVFTATVVISLDSQEENYVPTVDDADTLLETALGTIYNQGYDDKYVIFDGYPSIQIIREETEEQYQERTRKELEQTSSALEKGYF